MDVLNWVGEHPVLSFFLLLGIAAIVGAARG